MTLSSSQTCGLAIADAVCKLAHREKRYENVHDESTAQIPDPPEMQRLRLELERVKQLLDVCRNTSMCLFKLPLEVRLHIYSELLIQDSPVEFGEECASPSPRLVRIGRSDLFPALLRVNKALNREAKPLLYGVPIPRCVCLF